MSIYKKLMMIVSCLAIGSGLLLSMARVPGGVSQYSAPYAAKAMPAWSNSGLGGQNMQMPQATLDPEVLNSVMTQMNQNRQFMNQRIRPNQAISGRGFGAFRSTGPNLMRATSPVLMSTEEAANILNVNEDASHKRIEKAYQTAAKALSDLGGSHEQMQKLNDAKNTLLNYSDLTEEEERRYAEQTRMQDNDLLSKALQTGDDESFDYLVNKNFQFNDNVLQRLVDNVFSTPHMYEVVLPLYKDKKVSSRLLTDMLIRIRSADDYNLDRSEIVNVFIKNGYQFNLEDLFYTISSENSNFKALKALLSSELLSKDDRGNEFNALQTYQKLVQRLEKYKQDIDQRSEIRNKSRTYTLQDLNEALDLANNRLNQAKNEASLVKNETSFTNRMNNAFKGGMSSMWRQNK